MKRMINEVWRDTDGRLIQCVQDRAGRRIEIAPPVDFPAVGMVCRRRGKIYQLHESKYRAARSENGPREADPVFAFPVEDYGFCWVLVGDVPREEWPLAGDLVYFFSGDGFVLERTYTPANSALRDLAAFGNCFRTREEAQAAADKVRELLAGLRRPEGRS